MYGYSVALHAKVFRGHRRELFTARVVLVVLFDHVLADLGRSLARYLLDIVRFGRVRVDAAILQVIVTEKNHKMARIRRLNVL